MDFIYVISVLLGCLSKYGTLMTNVFFIWKKKTGFVCLNVNDLHCMQGIYPNPNEITCENESPNS